MALTRRFFTELAAKYRDLRPVTSDATGQFGTDYDLWEQMVRMTATSLAAQNGMFNYAKFYEACGMQSRTATV